MMPPMNFCMPLVLSCGLYSHYSRHFIVL